jgi:hypothetical protein
MWPCPTVGRQDWAGDPAGSGSGSVANIQLARLAQQCEQSQLQAQTFSSMKIGDVRGCAGVACMQCTVCRLMLSVVNVLTGRNELQVLPLSAGIAHCVSRLAGCGVGVCRVPVT